MTTLNLSLTNELRTFINQSSGKNTTYATPSEYVRDLIRRDKQRREIAQLKQGIIDGYRDKNMGNLVEYNGDLKSLMQFV